MNGRKLGVRWILMLSWLAVWAGSVRAEQPVRPPILETYSFAIGGTTEGTTLRFHDDAFGNGTAKCDITTHSNEDGDRTLWFRVQRRVPPGGFVFALLCSGIKIRCVDSEDQVVFIRNLEGFTFGDSASGVFTKSFRHLPNTVSRIDVTFFGNYE